MLRGINRLQIPKNRFYITKSPMEITYKKYNTTIYFSGSDGIDDTKGIIDEDKPIKLVVLDELTEFFDDGEGEDELANIEATFVRGNKAGFQMIYLYNPPKNPNAPVNLWCKKMEKRPDCIHIHTDYRDVPVDWLGQDLINSAARKKYVQVQFHRMEQTVNGSQYVIENTVLECQSGSREGTELAEEEWKKLSPFRFLAKRIETGSPEPQFVIDRLNIVNNADMDESNPMGVAIYANAIDVLKSLDIKYDSYSNEFELGRKRIFVAPEMMKNVNGSIAFDPEDVTFYMMPDEYDKSQEGLIKEVNMDLRSEQHSGAINDDLNYLSLKCGFGTERYKFDCSGVKTATEVISENSDMYRMIKKHEVILEDVLKELVQIIIRLGIVLGNPLNSESEVTIDFDDSIIEDKEAERQSDRQDVSMGAMGLWEYRAKYYGETEEQAKATVQQPEDTVIE